MLRRWVHGMRIALAVVAGGALALVLGGGTPGVQARAAQPNRAAGLQGYWGQVLTVTPKWLVIQNDQGQQFPVSLAKDNVGLFVVRWPTTPERLSPRAVVEVMGVEGTNNQIRTTHLDAFEPNAQGMLGGRWPAMIRLIGRNGLITTPYSSDRDISYNGYDYIANLPQGSSPSILHIVAPVWGINPLRLAIGNNNLVTVLPMENNVSMTQVTGGSASLVRPGDLVYYLPVQTNPRTLVLAQLIVYKQIPIDQFAP
jgi:hypothetical protein